MMFYCLLFIVSCGLTYGIRILALKKSLVAMPNDRSSHTIPTPHGGGIAIALTWFSGLLYLFICNKIEASFFYAMMCGSLLSIVSYLDDLYELSPKIRLSVQAVVSFAGLCSLGGLQKIDFGFWQLDNPYITNIFAFFGIMWFINLYNFLDGIDGYAGSEAIFLTLVGWFLFKEDYFLVLAVCVAGFLVWNWHKAKIFMGDVGSTLLGYSVAIFAIYDQNQGISIFIWVIIFGLFWFDATLTLLRRYRRKEKLSQAHRKHAYQRAVQSGLRHDFVVGYSLIVNAILAILGYSSIVYPHWVIAFLTIAVLYLYQIVRMVDKRRKFE